MPQRCDGTMVCSSRSAYLAVPFREQLLEPQEEQRLVARRGQRQAPDGVDGEARHPGAAGEPHERPVADDVADPRGGDVVGAPDHRPQQRPVAAVQRAVARLAQVGGHQHRLQHAGGRELLVEPAAPQAVARADREGHRSLPLRRPARRRLPRRAPSPAQSPARSARRAASPPRGVASAPRRYRRDDEPRTQHARGPRRPARPRAGRAAPARARCSPRPTTCAATPTRRPTATAATPTRPGPPSSARSASWTAAEAVVFASGHGGRDRRGAAAPAARRRARRVRRRLPGHPQDRGGGPAAARGSRCGWCRPHTEAIVAAADGATLVWVETPSNPRLDVCDLDAVRGGARGRRAAGGRQHGRHAARPCSRSTTAPTSPMISGTKALTGHSDVLLGAVSVRDPALVQELRRLAHPHRRDPRPVRGLARPPLAGHARAAARAPAGQRAAPWWRRSQGRDDVTGVRWPGVGPGDLARAADRRGTPRRSSTPVTWSARRPASAASTRPPSAAPAGAPTTCRRASSASRAACEDTEDLVADVLQALDRPDASDAVDAAPDRHEGPASGSAGPSTCWGGGWPRVRTASASRRPPEG